MTSSSKRDTAELERRVAERTGALKESEERHRFLYENTPVMMHSLNKEARLVSVNQHWLNVLGYEREEVLGQPAANFLTKASGAFAIDQFFKKEFLKTGVAKNLELQFVKKNGEIIDVLLSAHGKFDENHVLIHTQSFFIDVTERKKVERALQESQERLHGIISTAMDAIITIDNELKIILFNESAEKMLHCGGVMVEGQSIDRFLSVELLRLIQEYVEEMKQQKVKKPLWVPEGLTAIRSDGDEFPIEGTLSMVNIADQCLVTIILRDIVERKKAEEQLDQLQTQNVYLREELKDELNLGEITGTSSSMQQIFQHIEMVAATDSTVLLLGETGTGKELIARAIHNASHRKDRIMIKVNCGALPAGLVESELFGHEKGAFTGATTKKKGRFELADHGTIFLDEVGELPHEVQIKLLRVLQEQEFERVGGSHTIKVNTRVIAATNKDLQKEVRRGSFRADLFYRLNIFPISMPSLKERRDDIPQLAHYFMRKFSRRMGKSINSISEEGLNRLQRFDWPGNVRELANILERAVILCQGRVITEEHISIIAVSEAKLPESPTFEEAECRLIQDALHKTGGVLAGPKGAAALLGMNRSTLWSRMRKLGIDSKKQPLNN